MKYLLTAGVLGTLSLPLLTPSPEDLVRRGNAALARREGAAALSSFARAEERSTDPGLVAYNTAVALYQLGRYREAELHFRRCREDAQGLRLATLLAGLGNCSLRQSQGHDARLIDQAINSYEECLNQRDLDGQLQSDVQHNLGLARQLRLHAKEDPGPRGPKDEESGTGPDRPNQKRGNRAGGDERDPDAARKSVDADARARELADARAKAVADDQPPPGKGNLPPIPDRDDLDMLSPEDAAAHLRQAVERIEQAQRDQRRRLAVSPSRTLLDW